VPRTSPGIEGNTAECEEKAKVRSRLRAVKDPRHVQKHNERESGEPVVVRGGQLKPGTVSGRSGDESR